MGIAGGNQIIPMIVFLPPISTPIQWWRNLRGRARPHQNATFFGGIQQSHILLLQASRRWRFDDKEQQYNTEEWQPEPE